MEDISSIRIVGIDEKRPPRIRKEPYIDLYFKLSQQAPEKWCDDFNRLLKKLAPPAKIDSKKGLFIDAYVRDMDQIPRYLDEIKKQLIMCSEQYIENARLQALVDLDNNKADKADEGEQGRLDMIIAGLKFDN